MASKLLWAEIAYYLERQNRWAGSRVFEVGTSHWASRHQDSRIFSGMLANLNLEQT